MKREAIEGAIIEIIRDITPDSDVKDLDPAKRIRDQLDLDSMDFLDIVMELRKRYGVEVPESEYHNLATLNSCVDYLEPKLRER